MTISTLKQQILDGGLGLAADNGIGQHIKIGASSSGTVGVLKWFSDPEAVKAEYGSGPLVDAAVYHLENTGGVVGVLRLTASVAGVAGSVTVTRGAGGPSTATMTVTGAPLDAYQVVARFTRSAVNLAANLAAFVYSVDGGDTWSDEVALPTSGIFAIPGTGLTMTWVNGAGPTSFIVDDTFSFDCTAPGYSTTNATDALDVIRANPTALFRFVHLVGAAASAAASATMAAAVGTKMTVEENNFRYTYIWLEAADDNDANLISAFASFVHARVNVTAGYCELFANKRQMKRSAAWPLIARRMAQTPNRDLARTANDNEGGALPNVVKLYRDEYVTPGLDNARFSTLRTWPGKQGFFAGNGRTMAPTGSDFALLQHRELMDVACGVNYDALFPYLNDDTVEVDEDTGLIIETDARNIETKIDEQHRVNLVAKRWVSAAFTKLDRGTNILSTSLLKTRVRIRPRGYAKFIETVIGFTNPAFAQAAA